MEKLIADIEPMIQQLAEMSGIPAETLQQEAKEALEEFICPVCDKRMLEWAKLLGDDVIIRYKCNCGYSEDKYYIDRHGNLSDATVGIVSQSEPEYEDYAETPYQEIVEMFNKTCTSFKRVGAIPKEEIEIAWISHPDLGFFKKTFNKTEASSFLRQKANAFCSFSWILKNADKIYSGKYDDRFSNFD
jgi:hypothetical protein